MPKSPSSQPPSMPSRFDPYHRWLGIPPGKIPPSHYRLLGLVEFEDEADVIQEASDRQMGHVKRHAGGPHSAESQQLLNELASATLTLLDPVKKQRRRIPSAFEFRIRRVGGGKVGSPNARRTTANSTISSRDFHFNATCRPPTRPATPHCGTLASVFAPQAAAYIDDRSIVTMATQHCRARGALHPLGNQPNSIAYRTDSNCRRHGRDGIPITSSDSCSRRSSRA